MAKRREKFAEERTAVAPIRPLTPTQGEYLEALKTSPQVITIGCAGTGKTYLAGTWGADQLRQRRVTKIILTRPNVPGGRSLGFFPGTLEEKIAPWVVPLLDVIGGRIGRGALDIYLKNGDIEIVPFEVMRGRTFKDSFVILDEAQNTDPVEMKMFLTRVGEGSQVIINGDIQQSDLKTTSGLAKIIHMVKSQMLPIPVIEFTESDIVRSDICAMWIKAFNKEKL